MFILDTNVLSAVRRPERAPQVNKWLRAQVEDALFLSVITLGEIERGIHLQQNRNPAFASDLRDWLDSTTLLFADRIIPFGVQDARLWGKLSAKLGNNGADMQIAATALAHNAIVVTRNASDFEQTGVEIINPF